MDNYLNPRIGPKRCDREPLIFLIKTSIKNKTKKSTGNKDHRFKLFRVYWDRG